MIAVLSDIHGNLEALLAVLDDAARHGAGAIYCLGDTVGFGGPNPLECLDLTMSMRVVLLGNFDEDVLREPEFYPPTVERSVLWMRALLAAPETDAGLRERRVQFVEKLPRSHAEGDVLFVHASPRNPLADYVFPEDIYNEPKMKHIFACCRRYAFHSHTHIPGIVTEDRSYYSPAEIADVWRLDGRKTLCNVGSVGQPRDEDWRACYVLFDGQSVRFRRVEYDVETTIGKIQAIPELENFLGQRLREGR